MKCFTSYGYSHRVHSSDLSRSIVFQVREIFVPVTLSYQQTSGSEKHILQVLSPCVSHCWS